MFEIILVNMRSERGFYRTRISSSAASRRIFHIGDRYYEKEDQM